MAIVRKTGCGHAANIAEAKDADFHYCSSNFVPTGPSFDAVGPFSAGLRRLPAC
jgi:hypothetical protein